MKNRDDADHLRGWHPADYPEWHSDVCSFCHRKVLRAERRLRERQERWAAEAALDALEVALG